MCLIDAAIANLGCRSLSAVGCCRRHRPIEGRFALHPELANRIFGAVDREVASMIKAGVRRGDPAFVERSVDRNQLAAEALGTLVSGGHQQIRPIEADITVIVDAHTAATGELGPHGVCETTDGSALPPASVRRLLCGGRVTPVVVDQHGNPFDMGRAIRHANRRQRRALRAIYRCCAFAGCDTAFERCETTTFSRGSWAGRPT